ncbi:MFS transporter [Natronorubrum halophilum]|uniref:MFS transporter n=1 Tax=Natronorubrum halophilum TaxID=1702106 RepID=UPI000EF74DEF|nr:MFS transporter [Natronorubrum halophilum]
MTDDADSSAVSDATTAFLDDRDDGERALEVVLEADSASSTWTFDDIELDSGTFGELVSRGIVTKADGEYRVADVGAVEAVLAGEEVPKESSDTGPVGGLDSFELGIWGDRRALAGLAGALFLAFVMRITQFRSVFRDGRVVSPGNDPYFYRYWMEELLAESASPTDIGMLAEMPPGALSRRPLTHALNWWIATLFGGDQWAAELVATWLPVAATLALGVVVYALAVVVTRDVRVGIASVVLLAVAPVHAVYTQVGFLEHRLHQYFWLGVTLLTLAWLAVDLTRRRESMDARTAVREHLGSPMTWISAVVLGVALGVSVHLWGGSPLVFIPLAVYIGLRAAVDARERISPTLANLPVLVGLGIGSGLSVWLHANWGWRLAFVAYTPVLVLGGAVAVLALGDLWRHLEVRTGGLVALEAGVAGLVLYALRRLRPENWADARGRADDLLFRDGATETASLFTVDYAVIFGPLIQIGVGFYLGLAVLVWAVWIASRRYEPAWVLLAVYASVFMVFAAIQVRFAAQFVIPLSVLGGFGFVYALSVIDLARRPLPLRGGTGQARPVATDGGNDTRSIALPDGRKAAYILGIGLLVCGMSLLYVPGLSGQITHDDGQYEAVVAIEEHAAETDRAYPQSFVLSEWGDNRMYNYFVSGESQRYDYAMSNYDDFRSGDDPDGHYEQFEDRVGYVVVTEVDGDAPAESAQVRLLEDLGAGGDGGDALAHYQLLSVDDERSAAAFAVVPGATIDAPGEPGDTVDVRTDVSVGDESFAYEREVPVGEDGRLEVTVPYAGAYSVGDERVDVSETDVMNGSRIEVGGIEDDSN